MTGQGRGDTGLIKGGTLRLMVKAVLAEGIAAEVATLSDLPRGRLVELWEQRFGVSPPESCGRMLLELAAAYAIQEKAFGGLNATTRRLLDSEPEQNGLVSHQVHRRRRSGPTDARHSLKPGTRLVREWNGRTHHVEAREDGFVWNGNTYRSLSVIAREITGVQWSGPRFFGL